MPHLFATSYSTLSAPALASFVTETYALGSAHCQFLARGVGDTYLITAPDERFILRVYRSSHRDLSQIEAETELLTALKAADVSVSYPVADRSGKFIQALPAAEGTRHAVLFTYAPGRSVAVFNKKQLQLLGHQMAKFHHVSSTIKLRNQRWNINLETTLFQPLEAVKGAFSENQEEYAWLQEATQKVQAHLAKLHTSSFSTGYCHFDFFPNNFHFEGDGKLTLFDFDFFGHGWLVNDLMTFWQHLCLDVHFGKMPQETADAAFAVLVEAYREFRPVSEEELAAIPYLGLGFWLFYLGFYTTHDQFYPLLQNPHLKMRMTFIRQILERSWGNGPKTEPSFGS
ncbi:phosphotransferase enzyme family protein [Rufibacter sp. XAAS-G3-1]|uniref:phosphotransferase enzyme family protein n=1 Tax=Rufibacter sp. XAAS-G3-1 TaxID=2729134 RepID=UPI0015E799A0|nr:phosphotransferase [Rufibacter sp. XAAS-G3-1]